MDKLWWYRHHKPRRTERLKQPSSKRKWSKGRVASLPPWWGPQSLVRGNSTKTKIVRFVFRDSSMKKRCTISMSQILWIISRVTAKSSQSRFLAITFLKDLKATLSSSSQDLKRPKTQSRFWTGLRLMADRSTCKFIVSIYKSNLILGRTNRELRISTTNPGPRISTLHKPDHYWCKS